MNRLVIKVDWTMFKNVIMQKCAALTEASAPDAGVQRNESNAPAQRRAPAKLADRDRRTRDSGTIHEQPKKTRARPDSVR